MEAVPIQRKRKCCSLKGKKKKKRNYIKTLCASKLSSGLLSNHSSQSPDMAYEAPGKLLLLLPSSLCCRHCGRGASPEGLLPGTLFPGRAAQLPPPFPSGSMSTSPYCRDLSRPFNGHTTSHHHYHELHVPSCVVLPCAYHPQSVVYLFSSIEAPGSQLLPPP